MLRVVPQGGDGVAIEVAHHLAPGAERAGAARGALAGVFREQVGILPPFVGLLLGRVGVVLVGGVGLRAVQAERSARIGAVCRVGELGLLRQQVRVGQVVDPRRAGCTR